MSSYRDAKKRNNKTGQEFHTSVCYEQVDSVLNCRLQLTLPEVKECGVDEDDDDGENEVADVEISEDYMRMIREEKERNVTKNGKERAPRRVKDKDKVDRQLEAFAASEERHYNFMKEMMESQQENEKEEGEKDRDFFLRLAEIMK